MFGAVSAKEGGVQRMKSFSSTVVVEGMKLAGSDEARPNGKDQSEGIPQWCPGEVSGWF